MIASLFRAVPLLIIALIASSLPTRPAAAQDDPAIAMELNTLEANADSCTSLFVVQNRTDTVFGKVLTELVVFDRTGIIVKRLALDVAPLQARKTRVLGMRISGVACDSMGELLLNTVSDCQAGSARIDDCVSVISVSSRVEGVGFRK